VYKVVAWVAIPQINKLVEQIYGILSIFFGLDGMEAFALVAAS
jgi:hypothetical protein